MINQMVELSYVDFVTGNEIQSKIGVQISLFRILRRNEDRLGIDAVPSFCPGIAVLLNDILHCYFDCLLLPFLSHRESRKNFFGIEIWGNHDFWRRFFLAWGRLFLKKRGLPDFFRHGSILESRKRLRFGSLLSVSSFFLDFRTFRHRELV